VACTAAYLVIVVLGWMMRDFVKKNLRGASNTQRKTLEVQRQLTRTLIIQVAAFSKNIYYLLGCILIGMQATKNDDF
jgi:hypothetical protein